MRLLAFVLVALVVVPALGESPAEHDDIAWVRADGTPGWTTPVPRAIRLPGSPATPLVAPAWYTRLPDTAILLTDASHFKITEQRGKVLLVDFWASWCTPCVQELPKLQHLYESRGPKGLVVLAINIDESAAAAEASAKKLGLTMPIGIDASPFAKVLGARALPSTYLADRDGRLRARWAGYRAGDENDVAARVDALLASNEVDGGRPIADVLVGGGRFTPLWSRDLPGTTDGIVGLPKGEPGGGRIVASAGGMIVTLGNDGDSLAQRTGRNWTGRLLDFGPGEGGGREIVAFRPGSTTIGVIAIPNGEPREIAIPSPVVDAAVDTEAVGDARHVAVLTSAGTMVAPAHADHATPLDVGSDVRSIAARPGRGILALRADGTLGALEAAPTPWPAKAAAAARLLLARDDGAAMGPRTVIASAYGHFLPGRGRQLAVATYAGHLALLDVGDGTLLFDALWTDVHDLAPVDLDGDGLDELVVASGRSVAALRGASSVAQGNAAGR